MPIPPDFELKPTQRPIHSKLKPTQRPIHSEPKRTIT